MNNVNVFSNEKKKNGNYVLKQEKVITTWKNPKKKCKCFIYVCRLRQAGLYHLITFYSSKL